MEAYERIKHLVIIIVIHACYAHFKVLLKRIIGYARIVAKLIAVYGTQLVEPGFFGLCFFNGFCV